MNFGMIISCKVYDVDFLVFSCSVGVDEVCLVRLLFGLFEVGVFEVI